MTLGKLLLNVSMLTSDLKRYLLMSTICTTSFGIAISSIKAPTFLSATTFSIRLLNCLPYSKFMSMSYGACLEALSIAFFCELKRRGIFLCLRGKTLFTRVSALKRVPLLGVQTKSMSVSSPNSILRASITLVA